MQVVTSAVEWYMVEDCSPGKYEPEDCLCCDRSAAQIGDSYSTKEQALSQVAKLAPMVCSHKVFRVTHCPLSLITWTFSRGGSH